MHRNDHAPTPLRRVLALAAEIDGLAQGALTATGVTEEAAGSKVTKGVPTAARVPNGGIVERSVPTPFDTAELVLLNVHASDFTTTTAIVNEINKTFGDDVAKALDPVSITIRAPQDINQRVSFMSMVENLQVTPGEPAAKWFPACGSGCGGWRVAAPRCRC